MTRATTKTLYIMQPRELAAWFTDNWIWIWFTGLWPRCTRREGRWSWCIRVFGVDRNNAVTCFCLVHCCRITICFRHRADKLLQTAANFSFSRWIIETTLEQSGRNTCLEISLFFFFLSLHRIRFFWKQLEYQRLCLRTLSRLLTKVFLLNFYHFLN